MSGPWTDYASTPAASSDSSAGPWSDYQEPAAKPSKASEPLTFGNTLAGEAELAGTAIANIPAMAGNAADYFLQRAGGRSPAAGTMLPAPFGYIKPGEAGQNLVANVSELPSGLTEGGKPLTIGQAPADAAADISSAATAAGVSPGMQKNVGEDVNAILGLTPAEGLLAGAEGAASRVGGMFKRGAESAPTEAAPAAAAAPSGPVSPEEMAAGPVGAAPQAAPEMPADNAQTPSEQATGAPQQPSTEPLKGMPTKVNVPGQGPVEFGPVPALRQAAQDYARQAGIDYKPPTDFEKVDPERAKKIADAYDAMPHDPTNPAVQKSYDALIRETEAQWRAIEKTGLKVEFIKPDQPDPYAASPRLAIMDVRNNNHLWVYPTDSGFGSRGADVSEHPMLRPTGVTIDGRPVLANDLFRIVHDINGHVMEGNGFRADGEYNAWRIHRAMYSRDAQPALATETLGQNSWVNYGPHGEANKVAKGANTVYADQKAGIMPQDIWAPEGSKPGARPMEETYFQHPGEENARTAERSPQERSRLTQMMRGMGLNETRESALTGNRREAASDFQTSQYKDQGGQRMNQVIENERGALRSRAESLLERSGGSKLTGQGADYARGVDMTKPVEQYEKHIDSKIQQLYGEANRKAQGQPIHMVGLNQFLTNSKSAFMNTAEGEHLMRGVMHRAKELGILGPNDTFNPATVEQAERLRQYIGDSYQPRTAKLTYALKDIIDDDITKAAGENVYKAGRKVRAYKAAMLEEQPGVRKMLGPDDKLGIDRDVAFEDVPHHVENMDVDQFDHYLNVLHEAAKSDPKLAALSARALNQVRAHFARRIMEIGDSAQGMWNSKGVSEFLRDHETQMSRIFRPEEMKQFQELHDVGNALRMDRSYPGASAQHQQRESLLLKAARHGGKAVGTLAGAHAGGLPGALVGHAAGAALDSAAERSILKEIEKRITKLGAEPTEPTGGKRLVEKLPGQRGGPKFENNASGESSASLEAQSRLAQERAKGQDRFVVDPDGDVTPLHGVDSVDARAPKGSVIVQRGVGAKEWTILDRGGLPESHANGLVARAVGYGKLPARRPLADVLSRQRGGPKMSDFTRPQRDTGAEKGGGSVFMRKQAGAVPGETSPEPSVAKPQAGAERTLSFRHFSNAEGAPDRLTLSPDYYGRGLKGAEARRVANEGGPKVISAYGAEHPDDQVEPELRGKPEYRITVPASKLYDLSADKHGVKAAAMKLADEEGISPHTAAEMLMKGSGYLGYHVPNGEGIFKGQARFFQPVEATRVKPEGERPSKTLPGDVQQAPGAKATGKSPAVRSAFLTDEEKAGIRSDVAARLRKQFDQFKGMKHELAAAALAGNAKRGWYRKSAEAIRTIYGGDAPRFAATLAALSPQTSVESNLENAVKVFGAWDKAGRPTDPTRIRQIIGANVQGTGTEKSALNAWIPNTIRALTSANPEKVMFSGPKVNSFMRNLQGNVNEVTLDAWMAAFAKVMPEKLRGALSKIGPGKSPTYLAYSAEVRKAAHMLTRVTGEQWTPAEVQETVWSWAKSAYEHADSYGGLATIPELVKDGEIHDELIRGTPDFRTLFERHGHYLRSTGRGEGLDRLHAEAGPDGVESQAAGKTRAAAQAALKPHLERAARRLESVRQERRAAAGEAEAPF